MHFPVDARKAAHAVARLVQACGGTAEYLRIAKLIYLADRKSLCDRGVPIVGGKLFSMRKGPTNGDVMNLINGRPTGEWKNLVSARRGNWVTLQTEPDLGPLSDAEVAILDGVAQEHSSQTTDELVHWCHDNCGEYTKVIFGRRDIKVEDVLRACGKTECEIASVVDEAEETRTLDALLA